MIYKPEYVKGLLRKQEEGSLTAAESDLLRAAWMVYTDDEWRDMIGEVRSAIQQQEQVEWEHARKPDFKGIMQRADRRRRGKKMRWYGKRAALAGAAIGIIVAYVIPFIKKSWFDPPIVGNCANSSAGDIPLDGFACILRLGNSDTVTVDNSKRGVIALLRNLVIRQDEPGTLRLLPVPSAEVDSTGPLLVQVLTKAGQQYSVQLSDNVKFQLNAGSSLTYPLTIKDRSVKYVQISGDAHVQMAEGEEPERLIVETFNAQLQTAEGDFAVSVSGKDTRATLLKGELLALTTKNGKEADLGQPMEQPGDLSVVSSYWNLQKQRSDSLSFRQDASVDDAIRWTKTTRIYRNVSMREFVSDMSRWYGFPVNINCIPAGRRISVTICYQAPEDDLFAAILKKGVLYQKVNGVYTFCEPNPLKSKKKDFTYPAWLLRGFYH